MPRSAPARRPIAPLATTLALAVALVGPSAAHAQEAAPAPAVKAPATTVEWARQQAEGLNRRALAWYRATPPADRITWGGLLACGLLGVLTLLERSARVRRRRVIPTAFRERFHARLVEGKLDWAKGLDYCELNPSPAARVALAAIRRWGRPAPDLDRAVALARQVEADRLRRNIGTLRRIAALAPLIGLLGTLSAAGRALAALAPGAAWGPAVAAALTPLTAGVGLAILALVAYDGLMGRAEALSVELDRIGAELVDAVALAAAPAPAAARPERDRPAPSAPRRAEPPARARTPHGPSARAPIPDRITRVAYDHDAEV